MAFERIPNRIFDAVSQDLYLKASEEKMTNRKERRKSKGENSGNSGMCLYFATRATQVQQLLSISNFS